MWSRWVVLPDKRVSVRAVIDPWTWRQSAGVTTKQWNPCTWNGLGLYLFGITLDNPSHRSSFQSSGWLAYLVAPLREEPFRNWKSFFHTDYLWGEVFNHIRKLRVSLKKVVLDFLGTVLDNGTCRNRASAQTLLKSQQFETKENVSTSKEPRSRFKEKWVIRKRKWNQNVYNPIKGEVDTSGLS